MRRFPPRRREAFQARGLRRSVRPHFPSRRGGWRGLGPRDRPRSTIIALPPILVISGPRTGKPGLQPGGQGSRSLVKGRPAFAGGAASCRSCAPAARARRAKTGDAGPALPQHRSPFARCPKPGLAKLQREAAAGAVPGICPRFSAVGRGWLVLATRDPWTRWRGPSRRGGLRVSARWRRRPSRLTVESGPRAVDQYRSPSRPAAHRREHGNAQNPAGGSGCAAYNRGTPDRLDRRGWWDCSRRTAEPSCADSAKARSGASSTLGAFRHGHRPAQPRRLAIPDRLGAGDPSRAAAAAGFGAASRCLLFEPSTASDGERTRWGPWRREDRVSSRSVGERGAEKKKRRARLRQTGSADQGGGRIPPRSLPEDEPGRERWGWRKNCAKSLRAPLSPIGNAEAPSSSTSVGRELVPRSPAPIRKRCSEPADAALVSRQGARGKDRTSGSDREWRGPEKRREIRRP